MHLEKKLNHKFSKELKEAAKACGIKEPSIRTVLREKRPYMTRRKNKKKFFS